VVTEVMEFALASVVPTKKTGRFKVRVHVDGSQPPNTDTPFTNAGDSAYEPSATRMAGSPARAAFVKPRASVLTGASLVPGLPGLPVVADT
jgi:hypothetical protein